MNRVVYFPILLLLPLLTECKPKTDADNLSNEIELQFSSGNYSVLPVLADSLKINCPEEKSLISKADSLVKLSERILVDFFLTEEQVRNRIASYNIEIKEKDFAEWEKKNWLEYKIINGEKRYFGRSVSNLRLLKLFHEDPEKRKEILSRDADLKLRKDHTSKVIKASGGYPKPVVPVELVIDYTLTVSADAVPDGETIRCWLPWPKENNIRQQNIRFISTSHEGYRIAPDTCLHRSVYMEAPAKNGIPTIFRLSFSYRSHAQYFNLQKLEALPYNKNTELYRKYTAEQLPQINFSGRIKRLADSITSPEDRPDEIVRKIYLWFKENIPWTGALEYSIMPDIPGYVYTNRRGDCGMQTFLFMSMLRYKGIPVKWQSGWMVPPGGENLHDWCEVYFEGIGWVPADISYELQLSDDVQVKEFYMSGIDSYRLIVNDGIAGPFYPPKKFMRSEPYDFQRGEVEWRGGNLYFDKWDYEIDIRYAE